MRGKTKRHGRWIRDNIRAERMERGNACRVEKERVEEGGRVLKMEKGEWKKEVEF